MAEIGRIGWRVGGRRIYVDEADAWGMAADIDELEAAIESSYCHADELRGDARRHALAYDIDVVFAQYFRPAIVTLLSAP